MLVLWKVRLNGESGGCETNAFSKKDKKETGFQPATILRRRISTRMNCKIGNFIRFDSSRAIYHLVLGFTLSVHCRLVPVWWMANRWSVCFIIALHNFATLKNHFTYQCPSSWPVVIRMKKKLAGTWKKI